jgi:hypothetical protein
VSIRAASWSSVSGWIVTSSSGGPLHPPHRVRQVVLVLEEQLQRVVACADRAGALAPAALVLWQQQVRLERAQVAGGDLFGVQRQALVGQEARHGRARPGRRT